MATKNLGRTAVEGGRTESYKVETARTETTLRTQTRDYLRQVDAESADDDPDPRHCRRVGKKGYQTDKLRPVWKMLDGCVGRPWAKVWSEICEKFDARTLAGYHVLHDHIAREIDPHEHIPEMPYMYSRYYVDDHGIFRKRVRAPRGKTPSIHVKDFEWLQAWLGSRAILRIGPKLFWAVPTFHVVFDRKYSYSNQISVKNLFFRIHDRTAKPQDRVVWGRGKALSQDDVANFRALPACVQEVILVREGRSDVQVVPEPEPLPWWQRAA